MTPVLVIVMGVAGSGKSTLGAVLAPVLGARFVEGDDFHPPRNREAMAAGRPLSEAMRADWLGRLAAEAARCLGAGQGVVMACSALRRCHRDRLRRAGAARFLWLDLPQAVLRRRLATRRGHFFPVSLLESQIATLEPPGADEPDVTRIDGSGSSDRTLALALAALSGAGGHPG